MLYRRSARKVADVGLQGIAAVCRQLGLRDVEGKAAVRLDVGVEGANDGVVGAHQLHGDRLARFGGGGAADGQVARFFQGVDGAVARHGIERERGAVGRELEAVGLSRAGVARCVGQGGAGGPSAIQVSGCAAAGHQLGLRHRLCELTSRDVGCCELAGQCEGGAIGLGDHAGEGVTGHSIVGQVDHQGHAVRCLGGVDTTGRIRNLHARGAWRGGIHGERCAVGGAAVACGVGDGDDGRVGAVRQRGRSGQAPFALGVGRGGVRLAVDHDADRGVGFGGAAQGWCVVVGFVVTQGAGVAGGGQCAGACGWRAGVEREAVDGGQALQAIDGRCECGAGTVSTVGGQVGLGEQLADAAVLDVGGFEGGAEHAGAAVGQGDGGGDHVASAGVGSQLSDDGHAGVRGFFCGVDEGVGTGGFGHGGSRCCGSGGVDHQVKVARGGEAVDGTVGGFDHHLVGVVAIGKGGVEAGAIAVLESPGGAVGVGHADFDQSAVV